MFICQSCGSLGEAKSETPGSLAVEVVLWCCFLLPGVMYSVWRLSARKSGCAACGAQTLVPIASPVGQRLLAQYQPAAMEALRAGRPLLPPQPPQVSRGAIVAAAILWVMCLSVMAEDTRFWPNKMGGVFAGLAGLAVLAWAVRQYRRARRT